MKFFFRLFLITAIVSLSFFSCQNESIQDVEELHEHLSHSHPEFVVYNKKELFNDQSFNAILGELAEVDNNVLQLKSGNSKQRHSYKINYDRIRKITKGEYSSFTFLIDEDSEGSNFSNLLLERDGKDYKAYLLEYAPSEDIEKSKATGLDRLKGKLYITALNPDDIKLKSMDCVDITVTGGCPNPACQGGDGCLWNCDGGSVNYHVCFEEDEIGGGSDPVGVDIPGESSGGGGNGTSNPDVEEDPDSYTSPVNDKIFLIERRLFLEDLLGIDMFSAAYITIENPYLIDLQTFLKEGENVCWDKSGGFYYICKGQWIYYRDGQYYVDLTGDGYWEKAHLSTTTLSGELTSLIGRSAIEGLQLLGTYVLPVEDLKILLTATDFNSIKQSQTLAGAILIFELLPGGKLIKPVANTLGSAAKFFFKYGDDFLDLVKVSGVVKFTDGSIKALALKATNNATKTKVMLGRYAYLNTPSYVSRAGTEYKYYNLNEWDEISDLVNGNDREMWKINKKFIYDSHKKGNDFYFSHNPSDPNVLEGFFKEEVEYLENLGYTIDPTPVGENLWKATKN